MSRRMTPKQAAKHFRSIKTTVAVEMRNAENKVGEEALRIAQKWSSGRASPLVLAQLGHPYGLGPRPFHAANNALINKQTGLFYDSWSWRIVMVGGNQVLQLRNSAPYLQDLMRGTYKTIPRPFREAILKELLPIRRRLFQQALKRIRGKL